MKPVEYHAKFGKPKRNWVYSPSKLAWQSPKGRKWYGERELLDLINDHTCTRCDRGYDPDIRWMRIAFFADLHEISTKFRKVFTPGRGPMFIAPFCKDCRGDFLADVLRPFMAEKLDPISRTLRSK